MKFAAGECTFCTGTVFTLPFLWVGMTQTIYGVIESTDQLFINFFTDRESCNRWVASERMGDILIGPYTIKTTETTPFTIILGCDASNTIQSVYLEGEKYGSHNQLFGPYTVYEDAEAFEDSLTDE